MPAYKDPRTGHWYFKKQVRLPDGTSTRVRGVPKDYLPPDWEEANDRKMDSRVGAEEAERIAISRLRSSGTTEPPPPPPAPKVVPTVAEYLPLWIAEAESSNADSTIDAKKSSAKNYFLPTFGHLRLDEVSFTHVNEWKQRLLKPVEDPRTGRLIRAALDPKTVASLLVRFHGFLNFAVANDVIMRLPKKWPKVDVPEKEHVFLTFEEAERLIAAPQPSSPKPWSAWRWRVAHAMLVVALRTGLRIGELCALRWQNVDLAKGVIWVRESYNFKHKKRKAPKGKKHREVPLSNDAIRALRSIRQDRWESVFTINGSVLMPHVTDEALKLMCRSAGMLPFGWHRLRHTFASHLVMRGHSLVAVQEFMGHVNIRDTLRYAGLSPKVKKEAVMSLDEPAPDGLARERPARKPKHPRSTGDATLTPLTEGAPAT